MPYVYMAQNDESRLYVGVSKNPVTRLQEHNNRCGSLFTKQGNFKIVFMEEYQTLAGARKREIQIKKWRREKKERLIERYKNGLTTIN